MPRFKIRLKTVMIAFFVAIVLLTGVSILAVATYFFENLVSLNVSRQVQGQLANASALFENQLNTVQGVTWAISQDSDIVRAFNNADSGNQLDAIRAIRDISINYSNATPYIKAINLFSERISVSESFYNIFTESKSSTYGLKSHNVYSMNVHEDELYPYKGTFSLFKLDAADETTANPNIIIFNKIVPTPDQEIVIGILIEGEYFFSLFNRDNQTYPGEYYIVDGQNNVIFSPDGSTSVDLPGPVSDLPQTPTMERGGDEPLITCHKFSNLDWYAVNITERDAILSASEPTKRTVLIICIILMGIAVSGSIFFASKIIQPITEMVKNFKEAQDYNFSPLARESAIGEMDMLNRNYNKMITRISKLIDDVKEANALQNEYAFKALQAQINPHFLYNALDSVFWMAENEDIRTITHNLATFFRLSLSGGSEIISVHDELEQTRSYVNIMLIRHRDKFIYEEDISDDAERNDTPKLILQPIVENAVVHGMEYMKKGGVIRLKVYTDEDSLVYEVSDNGVGMDVEQVRMQIESDEKSTSYGLKNIQERIVLKYGKPNGISFENLEGGGARVTIRIPLIRGGKG
ncbi:MAG: sensor histidine kinase [Clostridiales Family XIII bacterium]|jgi:two-component system sensor histidine kinase YesM|nr:sensor histidine kinase [Clostridiales Family XIII bacterium]